MQAIGTARVERRSDERPARPWWILTSLLLALAVTACSSGSSSNAITNQPVAVTVAPNSASVQAGIGTQSLVATVTNATDTTVTWHVNGVSGGSATVGTVSAAGLYTAPASVPSPATVTVTASSAADLPVRRISSQVRLKSQTPSARSSVAAIGYGFSADMRQACQIAAAGTFC